MKYLPACEITPDCPGGMRIRDSREAGFLLIQRRRCTECGQTDKVVHRLNGHRKIISTSLLQSSMQEISSDYATVKIEATSQGGARE